MRARRRSGPAAAAAFLGACVFPGLDASAQMTTGFLDRTIDIDGHAYPYQVFVPREYDAARAWPIILFLHGAGERGEDGLIQTEVGIGSAIRSASSRFPAIVVFPQAPRDSTWHGAPGRAAMAALDRTTTEFNSDPSRVYLTGMSMGGNGSWYLAYEHPERFAALGVICGFISTRALAGSFVPEGEGSPFALVASRIRDIPIWIAHGDVDGVVPVSESRAMYGALRAEGARVTYVELPGVNHNSWDPTYHDPAFAEWLLAQRR